MIFTPGKQRKIIHCNLMQAALGQYKIQDVRWLSIMSDPAPRWCGMRSGRWEKNTEKSLGTEKWMDFFSVRA